MSNENEGCTVEWLDRIDSHLLQFRAKIVMYAVRFIFLENDTENI